MRKLRKKAGEMPHWLKRTLIISACILIFLGIVAVTVLAIAHSILNKIPKLDEDTIEIVPPSEEFFETDDIEDYDFEPETEIDENGNIVTVTPTTTAPEVQPENVVIETVDPISTDGLINILLVGQDKREGQSRQRSDTMILVSINPKTKEVSLISFLRDMYVKIPGGYSDNRLNVAYIYGGFKLLNDTLYTNFGVRADYNIEVDFTAFVKIIDKIGGVTISLTEKEVKYLNDNSLTVGENKLDGQQALAYARIRKIDSDFGRTDRQRKILLSIFDELKKRPVDAVFTLINEVFPLLTTDMTNSKILSLATTLVPSMSSMKIESYSVPTKGTYYSATIRKMQVLVPDTTKIRNLLEKEYLPLS